MCEVVVSCPAFCGRSWRLDSGVCGGLGFGVGSPAAARSGRKRPQDESIALVVRKFDFLGLKEENLLCLHRV